MGGTISLAVFTVAVPAMAALSDRIGRRNSMLCFGILTVVCTLPVMHALADVTSPYAAFGLIIVALAIASFYTSISGLIKAEMFPTEVRALGVGLAYAIGNAAFGGSAEYVALWLKSIGSEENFYWYVSAVCAVGLLVSLGMRDSGRDGYLKDTP